MANPSNYFKKTDFNISKVLNAIVRESANPVHYLIFYMTKK